jgi:sec-independent protein translocase protein TatC
VTHEDIKATKAPLMEHLIELRRRLIWSTLAIFITFLICLFFAKNIYNVLVWPYRVAAGVDTPIEMIYTAPQEFFFTEVKLALFGAIFISFPVIASQIYMFAAPGLYRKEQQAFLPYLVATPILFLAGAALVYFVAMPLAMKFFLSMQQTGDGQVHIQLTARVSEYLSLIMTLILGLWDLLSVTGAAHAARAHWSDHRRGSESQAPLRYPRRIRPRCGAHAARSYQPDRIGAADDPAL